MKKNRRWLLPVFSILIFAIAACAPVIKTQPQRLSYLKDRIDDNLERAMECKGPRLTLKTSEKKGLEWHDLYLVEGCGQRSEYITIIRQNGTGMNTWTTWTLGLVPAEEEYLKAAKDQLLKTAQFDTDCDALDFTILHALLNYPRSVFEATIGVKGCQKKNTYRSVCQHVAYTNGKHDISCSSMITSADGKALNPPKN